MTDILKKRRCTNALSAVIRISQIPTLLYDKAMANAHVFGIYIICVYDKRGLSALLILSRRQCESLDDRMSNSSDTRASFSVCFENDRSNSKQIWHFGCRAIKKKTIAL